MDAMPSKPGLFTFAQRAPPPGTGAWQSNANLLRLSGWLALAGAVVRVLVFVLALTTVGSAATALAGAGAAGMVLAAGLFVLAVTLVVYGLILYWVSYTYVHWCNRDRRGYGNAFGLGLVMAILGGLSTLSHLTSLGFDLLGIGSLLSLVLAAAVCVIGILILVNRSKPDAQTAFGVVPGQPVQNMPN